MKSGVALPAFLALAAAVWLPLARAEPVAILEKTEGAAVIAEFIAVSEGEVWIRRLNAGRRTETIPLEDIKAIDFGELPIELNASGAILMDPHKPGDTSRLWWAVDHRRFIVLFRTCRLDTGAARPIAVLKMEKETEARLAREDLAADRRRDLEIARVVLLAAKGQWEESRRRLARLRDTYRDDPVRLRFVEELLIIIRQELRSRRPAGDPTPARPGPDDRAPNGERRGERRTLPNP